MEKKYQKKADTEINEVINPIRNNWNHFTEKELEILLKKFGNICRDGISPLRKNILSDNGLAKVLLEIGDKYNNNSKILIQIVFSITCMIGRYNLEVTDDIFQFFITQTKNKKVNFYVSLYVTELPQFAGYAHKWDYIMSIPDIAPKKKSINTFYWVIKNYINELPDNHKMDAVKIFEKAIHNYNLHEHTVDDYLKIIAKLR